jgi:hypothetical protein
MGYAYGSVVVSNRQSPLMDLEITPPRIRDSTVAGWTVRVFDPSCRRKRPVPVSWRKLAPAFSLLMSSSWGSLSFRVIGPGFSLWGFIPGQLLAQCIRYDLLLCRIHLCHEGVWNLDHRAHAQ